MKHIFIINPTAGKYDSRQRIYEMADHLRTAHGLDVQCILTKKQGHATEIARKLCQTGEPLRFYACGGDGTVNEVANGIIGYDNAAMSVIPVGTGNDFLKNFGGDMDKFRDAENLWDGPQFPMDAIDVNGRVALTIACSGIDARVARDVHKYSESPILDGKSSYIASLLVNFLFKGIGSHWTVELDGDAAPVTVQNFMDLANDGFYDGLTFHRIIAGFMMQGGDPNGNGTGGSENTIKGEFSSNGVENTLSHTRGAISMARSQNPDSASSQFFICHADSTFLDGQYACFGYVTDGMDIVDAVCEAAQPTDGNGTIPADQQPVITAIRVID